MAINHELRHNDAGSSIANAISAQDTAIHVALRESARHAAAIFGRIGDWIEARRARRAITFELSQLDDRELADIGLTRSDIPAVARGKFQPSL